MFTPAIALVLLAIGPTNPAVSQPQLDQPFEVKAAGVVVIQGLRITFEGVSEDSRCPTGATCAWAGDAAAAFTLEQPPSAALQRTLHTNGRFEQKAETGDFVIQLADVRPYPKEGVAIASGDYRATLVVKRR